MSEFHALSNDQVRQLLTRPNTTDLSLLRTHLLLCLLLVLRLRLKRVLGLRLDQLNLSSDELTVLAPDGTKGYTIDVSSFHDLFVEYLQNVRNEYVYKKDPLQSVGLFPSGITLLTAHMFWRLVLQYGAFQKLTVPVTARVIEKTLEQGHFFLETTDEKGKE